MVTGADWRAGDAEREAVAGQLREHYAAGRLTMEEFRARLDAVYAVTTARELALVTADLPSAGPSWAPAGSAGPSGSYRTSRPDRRSRARRRRRRGLAALLVFAGLVTGSVLIVTSLPHGGLLLFAFLFVLVPLVLLTALTGAAVWVGRRAWRSGAWLELVPVAVGVPWLGRAIWLVRAGLVGRAFWRLGSRVRRPVQSRRAYARYQDYPGGPGGTWRQARAGDLSGTTR
jgi:uncharacterized protein DUF1707